MLSRGRLVETGWLPCRRAYWQNGRT